MTIPSVAQRIDATGKWMTPGLFHAGSTLGLSEVGSVDATNEATHAGEVNAAFNVAEGIDPDDGADSDRPPGWRDDGRLRALLGPGTWASGAD